MNQFTATNLVELFDRKYQFVVDSPLDSFMLDLKGFLEYLSQDDLIQPFVNKIIHQINAEYERYRKQLEKETGTAVQLKDLFIATYPDLDDSDAKRAEVGIIDYDYTFHFFNRVHSESYRSHTPLAREIMNDDSDVHLLIGVLQSKVATAKEKHKEEFSRELGFKIDDLASLHSYTHKEWFNYRRAAPGSALAGLTNVVNRINPEPRDMTEWRNMTPEQKFNHAFKRLSEDSGLEWIEKASYDLIDDRHGVSEDFSEKAEVLKNQLKRVYEGVRQEIGTTRLHFQLIDRYRVRCQWYNHESLRKATVDSDGNFVPNREDILTRDLALYLYDQGITAIYRPRFGKHEFDLLELDAREPMFVEAKAYKDSTARAEIVSGISQLHAYLSNYEAHKDLSEAFYVIFRLGGPIYELPRKISTNRFTMYPLLIDLGLSEDSGRKQPKPVVISEAELLESIKAENIGSPQPDNGGTS